MSIEVEMDGVLSWGFELGFGRVEKGDVGEVVDA